jgi:hypothetical protein
VRGPNASYRERVLPVDVADDLVIQLTAGFKQTEAFRQVVVKRL